MLSRVSEQIYWTSRYLERLESMARLIQTYYSLLLDLPDSNNFSWSNLLTIINAEESFAATGLAKSERNVLHYLITSPDHPGSILSCSRMVRENMRTLRDTIPREGWECVNEFYLFMQAEAEPSARRPRRRAKLLARCVEHSQQMNGLLAGTMSRGQPYRFLSIGRFIERADMTSRIVDVAATSLARGEADVLPYENTLWMAVLKSVSAYQMYRQHLRRRITGQDVVRYLLADADFPRSTLWSLTALTTHLKRLPNSAEPVQLADAIAHSIEHSKLNASDSAEVHEFIDQLQQETAKLHTSIQRAWFPK